MPTMRKRRFFKMLLGIAAAAPVGARALVAPAAPRVQPILLQRSPVAGFQYHQGESVWTELRPGAELSLRREPVNCYDARAVEILWQDHKLGYLPRAENTTIASLLDKGETLTARIEQLQDSVQPWQRVKVELWLWPDAM
ncbi:MAG: HIRAN domain-containing protein [Pseudomonadales bacterium]|nr:HIRAN domain-containing protein [Pseudomonadales bacterium]